MTSKKYLITAGLGIAAYLVFLVSFAPASWLSWAIHQQSTVALSLTQTRGTLWNGNGRLAITASTGKSIDVGRVRWHLNPWGLVIGSLDLRLEARSPNHQIATTITLRRGKIQLSNTSIQFPASLIEIFYPAAGLISPAGQIQVVSEYLLIQPDGITGEVELLWRNLTTALLGSQPVGDYRLVATGDGPQLQLKLDTLKGDLELNASGSWDLMESGVLQFSGTAHAGAGLDRLAPGLMLLGKSQPNGSRAFKMNVRLPVSLKAVPGFQ